jgi:hypothetical protein
VFLVVIGFVAEGEGGVEEVESAGGQTVSKKRYWTLLGE